jgi:hypothetical protein
LKDIRIGTVDLPPRIERERYFRELPFIELTPTMSRAALARWRKVAPDGAIALHGALFATTDAIAQLRGDVASVAASAAVFRSPPLFSPSTEHRERMRRFFGELATAEAIGATRVWIADGLWEPRDAIRFARELGITCAFDPLVREPGVPLEMFFELELAELYVRVERPGVLRAERMDDLAALVEHYAALPTTIAFATTDRWRDARNLKKLLVD